MCASVCQSTLEKQGSDTYRAGTAPIPEVPKASDAGPIVDPATMVSDAVADRTPSTREYGPSHQPCFAPLTFSRPLIVLRWQAYSPPSRCAEKSCDDAKEQKLCQGSCKPTGIFIGEDVIQLESAATNPNQPGVVYIPAAVMTPDQMTTGELGYGKIYKFSLDAVGEDELGEDGLAKSAAEPLTNDNDGLIVPFTEKGEGFKPYGSKLLNDGVLVIVCLDRVSAHSPRTAHAPRRCQPRKTLYPMPCTRHTVPSAPRAWSAPPAACSSAALHALCLLRVLLPSSSHLYPPPLSAPTLLISSWLLPWVRSRQDLVIGIDTTGDHGGKGKVRWLASSRPTRRRAARADAQTARSCPCGPSRGADRLPGEDLCAERR